MLSRLFNRRYSSSPPPTTTTTTHPHHQDSLTTTIANLVTSHRDPNLLTQTLQTHQPPIPWSPSLVDSVLKRLWNDGSSALRFFHSLPSSYSHSPSSFHHALDISARLRDFPAAWSLLSRMRRLGLPLSDRTFSILAERYVSAGKPLRAVRALLNMDRTFGRTPTVRSLNTLLDALCKSGRVEMAHRVFRDLKRRFGADAVSYNIIANGWCSVKKTPRAVAVLKEMVESGFEPTASTYNVLLKGYFKAGQVREGWEFFAEMRRRKVCDVVAYTTVIHGVGLAGDVARARRVFRDMVREGCEPSVATYNAMIQILCRKDSVENAFFLFDEMVSRGCSPNATTYNAVIRGLCHCGELDRAEGLVGRMVLEGCEPETQTYNVLIRHFCVVGEFERAMGLFERMGCAPNVDTYNVLINRLFGTGKSGNVVTAGRLLVEMVERGHVPSRVTFRRVLDGLLMTGNQGLAKEILSAQSVCGRLTRTIRL
ncbi:Pentatricopeptide repeat-containing protein [Acorus calamus]|uniref:Pentatricopeptide repeat-containing protein n=1 Tax=Acorus calamus TaxID=4465 RepID=A0AAV9CH12_ACOCL|nr:Pentatricopeptide repeat-containing protein [Acorus calamus]